MLTLATDENFEELKSKNFTIVDFYSTTCVPCKMFARVLHDISLEFPFINIVKLNTTDYPLIGKNYSIEAVPTVQIYNKGELLYNEAGSMSYDEVIDLIKTYYYGNRGE